MRVVFLTLYSESARGTRFVASMAEAAGHQVSFVHFKRFQLRIIPRHDHERLAWAIAQHPYQVREVTAEGERFHPFPSPVSDTERRLLAEMVERLKPDVIGMTFATHAFPAAVEVTALLRETRPGVPIVWGGFHAITDPEGCLAHADVVCPGEGEEAFAEFLRDRSRTDIAGLWFRTPSGAIRNPLRPLLQDLDALPWPIYGGDEYEIDNDRIERWMAEQPGYISCNFYTETARGCPFACTYCIHSICRDRYPGQPYVRNRTLENVMAEIAQFRRRFGLQAVLPFFDEILLINKGRFARFAQLYRRDVGHPFCGFAHHKTTDREMLEMAREAGIAETSVGLQTGSERVARQIYNRPIEPAAFVQLARDIHETRAGRLILNVLTDCELEQEEDLRATFDLLLQIPKPYVIQLSRIVPFPNSIIAQMKPTAPPLAQPVREFWNLLYLLTQSQWLDSETLAGLANDPYLRQRPEVLDPMTCAMLAGGDGSGQGASPPAARQAPPRSKGKLRHVLGKLRSRVASILGQI